MEKRNLIHLGIDNSLSGALAAIDSFGVVVEYMPMPVRKAVDGDDEVDLNSILQFIQSLPCEDYHSDVIITLERPCKFAKGKAAMQVMWYCFGMIKGMFYNSDYQFYTINPKKWQFEMLGTVPAGKTKEYAEKKILETYGQKFGKTKKIQGGVHDAILIAEYQRQQHLKIGR